MSAYSRYMDGDSRETGTPPIVEAVTAAAETANAATAVSGAAETANKIDDALKDDTPTRDILEAIGNGAIGGGSRDAVDEDEEPAANDGTAPPEKHDTDQPPPPESPADTLRSTGDHEVLPHDDLEDPADEPNQEEEKPIERPLSPDEEAMNAAIAKAREQLIQLNGQLEVINTALRFIRELPKEQWQEKIEARNIKGFFEKLKTNYDTFTSELRTTQENFLGSPDFERYVMTFESLELEGEKIRHDAAAEYRKTFKLQPNIRPIIQEEEEKNKFAIIRKVRNRTVEPIMNSIHRIAVNRGWGKGVDELFPITAKEKESIIAAYKQAKEETNTHRKDQLMELGIMGLMMTLHEIESMAAEAKQQANARHAA